MCNFEYWLVLSGWWNNRYLVVGVDVVLMVELLFCICVYLLWVFFVGN